MRMHIIALAIGIVAICSYINDVMSKQYEHSWNIDSMYCAFIIHVWQNTWQPCCRNAARFSYSWSSWQFEIKIIRHQWCLQEAGCRSLPLTVHPRSSKQDGKKLDDNTFYYGSIRSTATVEKSSCTLTRYTKVNVLNPHAKPTGVWKSA